jgi:hypothetical protein
VSRARSARAPASEGVNEREPVRAALDDQARGERGLEFAEHRPATAGQRLEERELGLGADRRGQPQCLARRQPRHALGDHGLDVLGDGCGLSGAHDLLDEERVAAGPRVCAADEAIVGRGALSRDQLSGRRDVQSRQLDALQGALAAQAGDEFAERLA